MGSMEHRCKLLHIKWMDNEVLLGTIGPTENYIQCPGTNHNEKTTKKNASITETPCYATEISTTL